MNTSSVVPFKLQALDMYYSSLCLGLPCSFSSKLFNCKHFRCQRPAVKNPTTLKYEITNSAWMIMINSV